MFEYAWLEPVLDELATLYVAADRRERDEMAAGVAAFNAQLASDPMGVGESRSGGRRVAFPPLLCVFFRVDYADRRVWVTHVSRYGGGF